MLKNKNCKDCINSIKIELNYFCKHKKDLIAITNIYDICKKYNYSADYLLGKIDYLPLWCQEKENAVLEK